MTYWSLCVVAAYMVGSIPTGLLVSRGFAGVDPRVTGSRNIGATNVLRSTGNALGVLTLIGDMGKGFGPVLVTRLVGAPDPWLGAVGLAAILGHIFPLWLRFKGGKGVATAMGVMGALTPWAAAISVVLFVIVVAIGRIVSLGSLVAAASLPLLIWLLDCSSWYLGLSLIITGLISLRHKENINRLLRNQEHRIASHL